jgi:RNA polymerase sigma-70 factor (ECF subfamily)
MDTMVRHLRRAVRRQDAEGRTDGQLLSAFIDAKDEAAFDAIVRRHGRMVFGVCRRIAGNHHDAEDAFQATFLVLARKAGSIRPREMVANWLHGVALRTSRKAKGLRVKRSRREKQVTAMPEREAAHQDQANDLLPLIDQELHGLPEKYRLPILLCDLDGKSIKDACRQLGWPQGTLAGRLARGRRLLAKRLANRGVGLSAGALAAVISQSSASAVVPTSLMCSTVMAGALIGVGQAAATGTVSITVAALTEGVLKTMLMTKVKVATTVLVATALLLLGIRVAECQFRGGEQAGTAPASAKQEKEAASVNQELEQLQGEWLIIGGESGGKDRSEELREDGIKLVISGDQFTITSSTPKRLLMQGSIRAYRTRPPKRMDLIDSLHELKREGSAPEYRCIYELDGDVLKVCYGDEDRPRKFTSKLDSDLPGEHFQLLVWKRVAGAPKRDSCLGHIRLGDDPRKFKSFFNKALGVMGEHFEQLHANQYEGRIEGWSIDTAKEPREIARQGAVNILSCDDGSFSISVRIEVGTWKGDKWTPTGRDLELEQMIQKQLDGLQN